MKILTLLKDSFLFRGIEPWELSALLSQSEPTGLSFKKGEVIQSSAIDKKQVGFILSGKAEVLRERGDGGNILLNELSVGDSFGILSVFSEEEFPTTVIASRSCEILFFDDSQIRLFMAKSQIITMNIVGFMADRIAFLNRRIATFSGSSVESRLAALILSQCSESGSLTLPFSYVKAGEEINASRASVYRAVASLEAMGLTRVKNKKICIIDRTGLERIIKQ